MRGASVHEVMGDEGRALLTQREREIITGEADVKDNYEYKVRSIVRNRIRKQFADDVAALRSDFPEVYTMIEAEVCEESEHGD